MRLLESFCHQFSAKTTDFNVHLQGGNSFGGAGDFEIHIAEVVFCAENIAKDAVAVTFDDQAIATPETRGFDGDAGSLGAMGRSPQTGGHRGRKPFEDVDFRDQGGIELRGKFLLRGIERHKGGPRNRAPFRIPGGENFPPARKARKFCRVCSQKGGRHLLGGQYYSGR